MTTTTGKSIPFACLVAMAISTGSAADHFASWPEGKSPAEIGQRVARHFIETSHQNFGRPGRPDRISYPEVCTWWGALTFAQLTRDEELKTALVKRFAPLLGPVPSPDHVDAEGQHLLDER